VKTIRNYTRKYMKLFYIPVLFISLFSCQKYETVKNCFEGEKEKSTKYKEFKIDSPEEIIKANPDHVKFTINKDIKSYQDEFNDERNIALDDENSWKKKFEKYNTKYSV